MMADWLDQELRDGETVIWRGHPSRRLFVFQAFDAFLIPFSLFWLYNVVQIPFYLLQSRDPMLGQGSTSGLQVLSVLLIVFLIAVGIYFGIGRFFVAWACRTQTDYALTNKRLLINSGLFVKTTRRLWLKAMPKMTVREKPRGRGTILFKDSATEFARVTGLTLFLPSLIQPLALENIENVSDVRQLVENARAAEDGH